MPARESSLSAVQKACRILGVLADTGRARLTEISVRATLNKVTTLRILEVLAREGYVERDERNKTYRRARTSLVRLAALSEDTVLLSVRQGCESVCIDRETGAFPIRAAYLDVGSRRPVGVGAGALAVFAWLPDDELRALLDEATPKLAVYPGFSVDSILDDVAAARSNGYTILVNRVVERMGAIGVPVIGLDGRPFAALSIAALSDRLVAREQELVAALQREARQLADPRVRGAVFGDGH
jgi:DNA-binding IclR family transcriptional regulator